jgi:hypothetical protein
VGNLASDWPHARLLASVPSARLEVRLHRDGTWWRTGESAPVVVARTAAVHRWGEGHETRLIPYVPRPLDELKEALGAVEAMARKASPALTPRELEAVVALALDFESGLLHDQVAAAARVFDLGSDDDDPCSWAECLLALRVALEAVSMTHEAPMLVDALARADLALDPFGSATLLVGDEAYGRITNAFPVDDTVWWGSRDALSQRLSTERVHEKLRAISPRAAVTPIRPAPEPVWLAAAAHHDLSTSIEGLATCAPEDLRGRFDRVMAELSRTPCPWLRQDLRRAMDRVASSRPFLGWRVDALEDALAPAPGRVPLLLYLPELHQGVVLELRVSMRDEGLWSSAPMLRPLARDAIRSAYLAVSACSDGRRAREDLEKHCVELVGPPAVLAGLRSVDGTSLALPAALAFASLWLGRAPASDVAATGALSLRPPRVVVDPVGASGWAAKGQALSAWADGKTVRLLASEGQDGSQSAPGIEVVKVRDLHDALEAAGVGLRGVSSWSSTRSVADDLASLDALFWDLQTQNLARHASQSESPWAVLGDRIASLSITLAGSLPQDDPRLRRAAAYAALAYTHAGEMGRIGNLRDVDPGDAPPGIAVVVLLSSLVRCIGAEQFEACAALRDALDDKLGQAHESERRSLLGIVRGTQGRSFLHDRRLSWKERVGQSLPLLRESVSHHASVHPAEAPRSRIYLAMALRAGGLFEEAEAQLSQARGELDTHTRSWSVPYFHTTLVYWLYERARLDVALGQPRLALDHTASALERADALGFWPALGILRTRAWAFRLLGEGDEAESCVAHMGLLRARVPESAGPLMDRIVAEAYGLPRLDGEVY